MRTATARKSGRIQKKNLNTDKIGIVPILLYVVLFVICAAMGLTNDGQTVYDDIEVGQISEQTITAPRDMVDEYTTELLRQEEMAKVQPVYDRDVTAEQDSITRINDVFSRVELVRLEAKQLYLQQYPEKSDSFDPTRIDWEAELSTNQMKNLRINMPSYTSETDVLVVIQMDGERLSQLKTDMLGYVTAAYETGFVSDDIPKVMQGLREQLVEKEYSTGQADFAYNVGVNEVKSNLIFNSELTEAARQAAADSVEEVKYKKNQNILQKGEMVTEAQYEMIKTMGLTSDDSTTALRFWTGAILMFIVFGLWILYGFVVDRTILSSNKISLSIFLLTVITAGLTLLCKRIDQRIVIVFLPAIIGAAFLDRKTAMMYGLLLAVVYAYIMSPVKEFFFSAVSLRLLLAGALGSVTAVLVLKKQQHRGEYLLAGLLAGIVNALIYVAYGIVNKFTLNQFFNTVVIGCGSGLVCGLLSVGLLPVWEALFSLSTPSKLLELANPGNPLLKRLMVEAPGTYHHSIMTANLAEAAAEAVGGNPLLARIASYYHDIGKLKAPLMFKENQMHVANPHDSMRPVDSARIILSHVTYGKELAERNKLPIRIRDIIAEHHGDTMASFFYYLAKKEGQEPNIREFRYQGPRPQTKESGVVMLADTVEAAVRASGTVDEHELRDQIKNLIKGKYDDGQLDECPLNRRDLNKITEAFIYVLAGARHERIVYPTERKEEK